MEASFLPSRFKRFLSGITLFIALTFIILSSFHDAFSSQVTLAWDPNTEPDLAGYKLYYGTASGDYAHAIDVGNTTMYTVTNLTAGDTYYFAVTAHDASGYESEHSNEVSTTIVQQYTLTARKSGNGTGTITGTGINCGDECANTYNAGATVMLTATPDAGSVFSGWSGGGCAGTGQCVMNMNANRTVTAVFKRPVRFR
jgi:Divergent InlB B-repeat domain/Fibronectin type III domain